MKPIYSFLQSGVDGFDSLAELALDIRWSWDHSADEIWRSLDAALWDLTQNPWVVLQTISRDQLQSKMDDQSFRDKIETLTKSRSDANTTPAWFQQNYPNSSLKCVAYFSMEYMLSEALPIYSGGLGNVAGDQLKTASDLGIPIVGVGLLYQQGYFRQEIDRNGVQQALYPYNDPGQLPITPLRHSNGELLRLRIALPGYSVWLRAWQVQVGRVKLYLLDSNDAANFPIHRGITSELYGGGNELRLKQEMVLGIGGWRLLNALGLQPQVCHLNEGHAAFAILERAFCFMNETGQPFEVALAVTRAGNIFTTHTAVAAGFDCFTPLLIHQYLSEYAKNKLGISFHQFLALGRKDSDNESEKFNMAYLAIRGSSSINGVSRLHGEVSRHMFEPLFPKWPTKEIPVGYITNGVHMPTWDSKEADILWTEACGKDRWLGMNKTLEQDIRRTSDERLWKMRTNASKALIDFTSEHFSKQLLSTGFSNESVKQAKFLLDPNVLTLGFARRFATYKRPNLLLHDSQRLIRLLTNPEFPVQLILAGKAHPVDQEGQDLIKEWVQFIRQNKFNLPIVFLVDYDMHVSESLVQGVDVWINTPRRPWEASGTSGMKVLVNGGINLSELDGWWAEAYTSKVGWALGDGDEHQDNDVLDDIEAEQLYNILEQEVVPEFYNRNEKGVPTNWISRMRESMAQLTPRFSADRTVREYTEQHYMSAATSYQERAANKGKIGAQMIDWQHKLEQQWDSMRFGESRFTTIENQHKFEVEIYFNDIDPYAVKVELFANGINGEPPFVQEMILTSKSAGLANVYNYTASTTTTRPALDYTVRVIPYFPNVSIPLEISKIKWQR